MKALVKKSVIAASVAAAMMVAGAASADPFTVVGGALYPSFDAGSLTGSYNETITFNTNGTFDVALIFQATAFNDTNGAALAPSQTGLGVNYGLYALYNVSGTYSTSGGQTNFLFTPGSGGITLYKDTNLSSYGVAGNKTTPAIPGYTAPADGTGIYTVRGAGDDIVLASGEAVDPSSGLLKTGVTCGTGGIDCGSFGSTTTFDLTAAGSTFFIDPSPFYNMSFQSGVLTTFKVAGTQQIPGTLNVVFNNAVPEPASLGLLGLGLLGLGVARRRKQKQA